MSLILVIDIVCNTFDDGTIVLPLEQKNAYELKEEAFWIVVDCGGF